MKKRILFSIIGLLVITQVRSQIEQGVILLGGTAGFNTSSSQNVYDDGTTSVTTDGPTSTNFHIMPWAGYMITESFAAGLGIGFSSVSSEYTYIDFLGDEHTVTNKTTSFNVAPGVRYYYVHMDMTHLFLQLSIPIGSGKITSEDNSGSTTVSTESKLSSFGVGIYPGVDINIGERCAIEATYGFLGYTSSKQTTELEPGSNEDTYSNFGIDFGVFGFGIMFFLGGGDGAE